MAPPSLQWPCVLESDRQTSRSEGRDRLTGCRERERESLEASIYRELLRRGTTEGVWRPLEFFRCRSDSRCTRLVRGRDRSELALNVTCGGFQTSDCNGLNLASSGLD